MKVCKICGKEKNIEFFSTDGRTRDGFGYICKDCHKNSSLKQKIRRKQQKNKYSKKWYNKNKDKKKKYDKQYNEKTKERRIKRSEKYYLNNRDKIIKKSSDYVLNRYKNDENFNIQMRLRHRLREAFRRYSINGKVGKSKDYDIDWQKIIEHLGPCPGKREDYHIDHIVPLCSFDFDNKEEVRRAFAPENHQWLTKEENLRKNKSLPRKDEE